MTYLIVLANGLLLLCIGFLYVEMRAMYRENILMRERLAFIARLQANVSDISGVYLHQRIARSALRELADD